ncbi:Trm112p-domain-containing protein [Serendipita vermifera]|nr:Trm112p-domain-containing protein [Serendipita vermifera]
MVRLITHNLLACHVRGCSSNNFPLIFKDVQIELREAEYNPDFLRGFMPKLEWRALVDTAKSLNDQSLPEVAPEPGDISEEFLKALHHVLLEIHVEEGGMVCPNCNHVYPISNGIPNMVRDLQSSQRIALKSQ